MIDSFLPEGHMHNFRYCLDMDVIERSGRLNASVHTDDVNPSTMLHILEEKVLGWPLCDIRLEFSYRSTKTDMVSTDDEFLRAVFDGARLVRTNIQPASGEIDFTLTLQNNMAEFEKYNALAHQHNLDWIIAGKPEDIFNPVTGEIYEIKDKYLPPADTGNPYTSDNSPASEGPLGSSAPTIRRTPVATIHMKLSVNENTFILEVNAKDLKNRTLYSCTIRNEDLSTAVKYAIQRLFGNPELKCNQGEFLAGIPMLLNGKKLPHCDQNELDTSAKFETPELNTTELQENTLKTSGTLLQIIIPIISVTIGLTLPIMKGTGIEHALDTLMISIPVSFTLAVISALTGKILMRQANIKSKEKLFL